MLLLLLHVAGRPLHHHLARSTLHLLVLVLLLHVNVLLLLLHGRAYHDARARMAHHPHRTASDILLDILHLLLLLLLLLRRRQTRRVRLGRRQAHRHSHLALPSPDDVGIVTRLAHDSDGLRGSHRPRAERTVEGHDVVVLRVLRQRRTHLLLLAHTSRRRRGHLHLPLLTDRPSAAARRRVGRRHRTGLLLLLACATGGHGAGRHGPTATHRPVRRVGHHHRGRR